MLVAMFDHVTIRVGDRAASERFYDTVLAALGIDRTYRTQWFSEWEDFSLTGAGDGDPPTRRLHVAFAASSREHVDAFWRAGVDAGYTDDGKPGLRPQYGPDYYGGFLLDPDGAGVRLNDDTPDRAQFTGTGGAGSFSLVSGTPTENLHMAFPSDDDGAIDRFHQAAVDAGYRSNGEPGERPRYHPGYYSAYVLDPDGNNIEVVNHHRDG
jgi:catechol 2,3-dioxygenase-like lactoylglutathione lyase family enzyme